MTRLAGWLDAFAGRVRPDPVDLVSRDSYGEGAQVRAVLTDRSVTDLTAEDINKGVEGNLWALSGAAVRYYLPGMMHLVLTRYDALTVFAVEVVGALTEPSREDVVAALDRLADLPPGLGLTEGPTGDLLRRQQLEWFDSGTPSAIFHERFDELTPAEGRAVLEFLEELRATRGDEFLFGEIDAAIARHWGRFGASGHPAP